MSDAARGLLAVWMDADPAGEADFNAWYNGQHVAERVGVPGFRSGCRYVALSGAPRYFACYDTDEAAVLSSPAYQERLDNPTPWTQRIMPHFRNTVRAICDIVAGQGRGVGGVLRSVRIEPAPGRRDALREGLQALVTRELADVPGLLRVRLGESTAPADAAPKETVEGALRGPDASATFVLLLEATDPDALAAACPPALEPARLAALGAGEVQSGDYRLLYALTPGL